MKINEKNLLIFATCNSPVDKEGYLMMKSDVSKAYQKRWFMLKGNLLFYFEKKGEREPLGVVILEGCTVELSESMDYYGFEIVFNGNTSRNYVLITDSQEDMEGWMKAITCAGYEYMKLMVAELQHQLDEINTNKYMSRAAPSPKLSKIKSKTPNPKHSTDGSTGSGGMTMARSTSTPARFNPFDGMGSEQLDSFGAVPFLSLGSNLGPDGISTIGKPYGTHPRTFEEMHEEFGYNIHEKQKENEESTASDLTVPSSSNA